MEVLVILLWLGVAAIVIVAGGVICLFSAFIGIFIWVLFPFILGIPGGILLWRAGHDNLGVLVGIIGIIWGFKRLNSHDDGSFPPGGPMSDKKSVYNSKGKVTGYVDRD